CAKLFLYEPSCCKWWASECALDNLQDILGQPTPWGLTVAQTLSIVVVAFVLLIGWIVVRVGLRLTGLIFRLGCAALIIFVCGNVRLFILAFSGRSNHEAYQYRARPGPYQCLLYPAQCAGRTDSPGTASRAALRRHPRRRRGCHAQRAPRAARLVERYRQVEAQ